MDRTIKAALLSEIIRTSKLMVTDDATIAFPGLWRRAGCCHDCGDRIHLVLEGTQRDGVRRAGGWGYVFGDEGGAFDIVRQALRAALRHEEGWGPSTQLRDAFLEWTGERDANAILHAFYTTAWPRARVAKFAPLVNSLAEAGDAVSRHVLEQAADRLARFALAVRKTELWDVMRGFRFRYIGGVFRSELLLSYFQSHVESHAGCSTAPPIWAPPRARCLRLTERMAFRRTSTSC